MSALGSFLKENLGVTFYAGGAAEYTRGAGLANTTGVYIDTNGSFGVFTSGTETQGANVGAGLTAGYQFGLQKSFQGTGYDAYNVSTPILGVGVTVNSSTQTFAGAAVSTAGKFGLSTGPTKKCIYGNSGAGC
jgi:hypothetical protein